MQKTAIIFEFRKTVKVVFFYSSFRTKKKKTNLMYEKIDHRKKQSHLGDFVSAYKINIYE